MLPWSQTVSQVASLAASENGSGAIHGSANWLPIVASLLAVGGILISWYFYGMKRIGAGYPKNAEPGLYRLVYHKFYIDELYHFLIKRLASKLVATPITWIERTIINGVFDWVTFLIRRFAFVQSLFQSGQVQFYIAVAFVGLFAMAWYGGLSF